MKEAMWGVGLIMLAVFGIFLISLFGNITVTNQQDYTAMKNTVEAAMYDAVDMGLFRTGFCVCTNLPKENGKYTFKSSSDYEISSLSNDVCVSNTMANCEKVEGEYIIDKKVFAESLVRRFAESVKGNNDYQIIVEDVIEYPPKVSVNIRSTNTYDMGGGEYNIDNHIDAILEMDSKIEVSTSNICSIESVSCNESTGICQDKDGNECGHFDYKSEKCKDGDVKCTTTGNKLTCKDSMGNICVSMDFTIPKDSGSNNNPSGDVTIRQNVVEKAKENLKLGGCFPKGTKILAKTGLKEINDIKINDYVLTYNKMKNINEYKRVSNVFIVNNPNEKLYTITTDDTDLILTSEHGVYTKRGSEFVYVMAKELNVGDVVRYSDGMLHKIAKITIKPLTETVYNIETEDNHNFYVTEKGILVHNASAVIDTGHTGADGSTPW